MIRLNIILKSYYLINLYNNINNYNFFKLDNFPSSRGIVPIKSLLFKYLFIIKTNLINKYKYI